MMLATAVAQACKYGTLPVAWTRHQWTLIPGRGITLNYNRLDNTPASVWLATHDDAGGPSFGSGLQSLDPLCPIHNMLSAYFEKNASRPRYNRTILFLGDSLDAQILDFVCVRIANLQTGTWFAFVHSHRNVNYCHVQLPNGDFLTLVQMYLLRNSLDDDKQRIDTVQRFFDNNDSDIIIHFDGTNRSSMDARIQETAIISRSQPDLIVFGGVYWPLHRFVDSMGENNVSVLLPVHYVKTFIHETDAIINYIQFHFHDVRIVMRNSPEIRTDLHTGSNIDGINKRTWGRKSYVAALNEAVKHITRIRMLELFDLYALGSFFQPMQLTGDDIHPNSWFQFELLNLYLNALR